MIGLVVLAVAGAVPSADASPVADLRVDVDDATFAAAVVPDPAVGYRLRITCTEGCAKPVRYEADAELPLGLFPLPDADGLLLSTWATGSVYRVRVHRLTATGVVQVLDAGTLGAPDLLFSAGAPRIVTTERRPGRAGRDDLRRVTWRWDGSAFKRQPG